MTERTSDFWVITSFFNPAGYRRHLEKFWVFRQRLGAPLLAVELSYRDGFELSPGDADILIQHKSDQVLWQKERLLNLAIEALPEECRYVAWVDSDLVFERSDWVERTREALQARPLVQPYGRVFDLCQGAPPQAESVAEALLTRRSLAAVHGNGGFDPATTSRNMVEVGSPGHAWAMRKDLLQDVGLYDAMIVGSGDNAMAMAALGHIDRYVAAHRMTPAQEAHYRRWAERFFAYSGGDIGIVHGDLYHLWHGDLANRGYLDRYPGLERFDFDPWQDIVHDENGVWRWATDKPELHAYVADYFESRKEDG